MSNPNFAKLPDSYRPLPLPDLLFRNFGHEEHAQEFIGGQLRLKTLSYYRRLESKGDHRGDQGDGTIVDPMDGKTLKIQDPKTGVWHPIKITSGEMKVSAKYPETILISCYSVVPTAARYGSFQVEISDVREFIARIGSGADCHRLGWGQVEYSDRFDLPFDLNVVCDSARLWRCKRTRFADDKEFRLMVGFNTAGMHSKFVEEMGSQSSLPEFADAFSLKLHIGDISDIASFRRIRE